jgi:mono/diheme cytochrome c family protein
MLRQLPFVLTLVLIFPLPARAADVDVDDLSPGLVTTYCDDAGLALSRIEPTVALALKAGEAPHPRLTAKDTTARWEGYVNVLRPGIYRFSATLLGRFRLTVAGQQVLTGEIKGDKPVLVEGPETRLPAGAQPIVAEYSRLAGGARVELLWQASYFRREPLPYNQLGHLPAKAPPGLAVHRREERGRQLIQGRNCTGCHRPADSDRLAKTLVPRYGPDLSQVGQRAQAGWLYEWLGSPQKLRRSATMPQLFGDDETGRVERYAVTRYLVSLGGPLKPTAKPQAKDVAASSLRGQRLFTSTGCIACHWSPDADPPPADKEVEKKTGLWPAPRRWEVSNLSHKTTPEHLAAYLLNPLAVNPDGQMPNMLLTNAEATDLARYLCQPRDGAAPPELPVEPNLEQRIAIFKRVDPRPDQLKEFQRLSVEKQWLELGQRLVIDRGCNNCHKIEPGGKPFANQVASASFDDIKQVKTHTRGCLADDTASEGRKSPDNKAPVHRLADADRQALRHFLLHGTKGAGTPAPAYAVRLVFHRANCLACHSRDGEGGIPPELVTELRRYEKVEDAEALTPPPLTGVGHKLRTAWVRQVLTQGGRARPWMGLRMPQYGEANVGRLPEALAALEGAEPDDAVHHVPLTAAKLEAGRHLVGKGAFGCIACHDIAGNVGGGTRGPDLALMNQRVRFDWYRRWLEDAQRMQPGTRMPTVFPDGKSLLTEVLGGNADAQAEAMWAYLSLGPTLPLPPGMEPPKGLVLSVKDRPVLLRTFLPEAGTRAVAVGYPGGVATAFDAATCRLAYAWSGNFLDASPVWNDRGGSPAKVLGPRFWTAPAGPPWGLSDSAEPPDFTAQARDPAFGAALPEGKVFDGRQRLFFQGYSTDATGFPTYRYRHDGLEVAERPEPLRCTVAVGLARRFTLTVPAKQTAWLRAGETPRDPRLLDDKGGLLPLDLKAEGVELPTAGRMLVVPQDGERVMALALTAGPAGSRWHLRKQGSVWQVLLRLPTAAETAKAEVVLRVWAPYRDEPGLWKELVTAK